MKVSFPAGFFSGSPAGPGTGYPPVISPPKKHPFFPLAPALPHPTPTSAIQKRLIEHKSGEKTGQERHPGRKIRCVQKHGQKKNPKRQKRSVRQGQRGQKWPRMGRAPPVEGFWQDPGIRARARFSGDQQGYRMDSPGALPDILPAAQNLPAEMSASTHFL